MNKVITFSAGAVIALGLSTSLTGCAPGQNTLGSTAVGAGLGGILGAVLFPGSGQWLGVIGGALVGGIVGNQIGQYMDRQDAAHAREIYTSNSGSGSWTNSKGYNYSIKPVKTYTYKGHYCRKYLTRIKIGDKYKTAYGRACRVHGKWYIQK